MGIYPESHAVAEGRQREPRNRASTYVQLSRDGGARRGFRRAIGGARAMVLTQCAIDYQCHMAPSSAGDGVAAWPQSLLRAYSSMGDGAQILLSSSINPAGSVHVVCEVCEVCEMCEVSSRGTVAPTLRRGASFARTARTVCQRHVGSSHTSHRRDRGPRHQWDIYSPFPAQPQRYS